jgi:pimeloyl-ACP methyl ester carboxylesterase
MSTVSEEVLQERQPFDVAWRTIDGLEIRYATNGRGDQKVVLFSPWPESIFAFTPAWRGLTKQFEVLAIDLPGFGRSEARDDLFAPRKMGEFIAKALDALPHARLDVLEAGHCVWEERAPEFESIVTQWVNGGYLG